MRDTRVWTPWLKTNLKWELVVINDGFIVEKSGLTSKDATILYTYADYLNNGVLSDDISQFMKNELDNIKAKNPYIPANIKLDIL